MNSDSIKMFKNYPNEESKEISQRWLMVIKYAFETLSCIKRN